MEIELIKKYYNARGLAWPEQKDALLFYLSEVGELAEAYLAISPVALSDEERQLLADFAKLGMQADEIVSRVDGWVRNFDRQRKENIAHEVADCNMMLSVFMESFAGRSPDDALRDKMTLKLGKSVDEL
ncbi:MAG TPA: hypothetical protein PKI51_03020 [Anaerolineaceae bacterium]|nr:hypothetical protein [Anaerolineaceae bacterium]HQL91967.1 hypothetical protein [Anaerolineaceae bacterium]